LPTAYKSLIRTASSMANEWMQACTTPPIRRRSAPGRRRAQLRPFSQPVMDAVEGGARALCRDFEVQRRLQEGLGRGLAFRNVQYLWWQVAELTYDSYLVRNRTRTRAMPPTDRLGAVQPRRYLCRLTVE
jgi:TRAP-type mannitol/chloroaromatic compound transport system substrate-binding protein